MYDFLARGSQNGTAAAEKCLLAIGRWEAFEALIVQFPRFAARRRSSLDIGGLKPGARALNVPEEAAGRKTRPPDRKASRRGRYLRDPIKT
ncbi:MAG: hypothetical protein SOU51_05245, partial [Collinsella sp.]|nr:hypothetical protein [Collinsella sp.]